MKRGTKKKHVLFLVSFQGPACCILASSMKLEPLAAVLVWKMYFQESILLVCALMPMHAYVH